MDRVKRYILGLAVGMSMLVLVLAVIIAITLNSGSLDQLTKQRLTDYFNGEFRGKLRIEKVDLQFPSKVILHRPELYRENVGKPDVSAEKLTVNLNFLRLLSDFSSITIRSLQADSLFFHLERYPDGTTSIEQIFAPRKEDVPDTPGLEHFQCGNIELSNCSAEYLNFTKEKAAPDLLTIKDINLRGKRFRYSHENISGIIRDIRFSVPQSNFALQEGSAKLSFTNKRLEILDLKAKTDKSNAELSIGLYEFNIFSSDNFEQHANSPAMFSVKSAAIHTDDLDLFLPEDSLPPGIYRISGNAEGLLRKIDIDNALISHENSFLQLKGELLNLNQPEFFGFRFETDSSKISGTFLQAAIPDTALKNLAEPAGNVALSGYGQGNLHEVYTELSLGTEAGNVQFSLQAEFPERSPTAYNGDFVLQNFELHRFLVQDTGSSSSITCTGTFSGKGLSPQPLEAALSVDFQTSYWQQQELTEGSITLNYISDRLKTQWDLAGGGSRVSLDVQIDWSKAVPVYDGKGSAANLDLSKILGSEEIRSNLTFSTLFRGEHFDPEKLNGYFSLLFSESTINDYNLQEGSELTLRVTQKSPMSSLVLTSDFLDFSAEGRYTLRDFLSGMNLTARSAAREAAKNNIWSSSALPEPFLESTEKDFSADYTLTVRDISPLAVFLPLKGYRFSGKASGKSYRSNGSLHLTSSINIERLSRENVFSLENAALEIAATYNNNGFIRTSFEGNVSTLETGKHTIEQLSLTAAYDSSGLKTGLGLTMPEIRRSLITNIAVTRNNNVYRVTLEDLSITDPDGEAWTINKGARFDIGKNYSRLYELQLRKEEQTVICNGLLSNDLTGLFECSIRNLDLQELVMFFPDAGMEGVISSSLRVSGSPDAKTATLKLTGRNLVYDDVIIGNLNLQASHKGERLQADVTAGRTSPEPLNDIRGTVSIPLRINWSPPEYSIPKNRPVAVSCSSDHLSAEILELLLPFFDTAEGTIPAKLVVKGKTPEPDIYFSAELKDTEITVTPTETVYRLSGSIGITPDKADFSNILIKDVFGGTGRISGTAALENLEATTIDLTASFENLLLFNKQDKKDETSFGTITGTSDKVRFYGDISQPVLTGNLLITNADFTLYRKGSHESTKYVGAERFITFVPRYPEPADTTRSEEPAESESPEFYYTLIDIVQIQNLRLESASPLKYNMIFDRTRGEQLETTLQNLSLTVNKNQQSYRLFGSVDISSGKYLFSNTYFDLEDGGRIVWNNVDIRNGVMENLFGRKFVNASNVQTGERDNVRLLLAIQGTLNNPDVQMGYYLNDDSQPYSSESMIGAQSSKIDPNAEPNVVSLLLTKQWYIRPGSQGGLRDIPFSSVGFSAGTGLLSSRISRFVEETAGFESFSVNVGVDNEGALSGLEFSLAFLVPGTGGKVRFIGTGSSPDIGQSTLFNYYGNSQQLEYRINSKLFFETYRSYGLFGDDVTTTNLLEPQETYGVSLSYRERFYSWQHFWNRVFGTGTKK
ncbi:MAG: translocation/assembly module TamB [Chlorobiales bacterium]|nr:translocation/assembly module TamB [Chlorobiales bacterium]